MDKINLKWTEEVSFEATITLARARELYSYSADTEVDLPESATAEEILAALKEIDLADVLGEIEADYEALEERKWIYVERVKGGAESD